MLLFLFLALLSFACGEGGVPWYVSYRLPRHEILGLTESNCFRGTYGRHELSLFTCPIEGSKSFATLPVDASICFVETNNTFNNDGTHDAIKKFGDSQILWHGANEIIVGHVKNFQLYPLACGSRSDYRGAALNVIRVPTQAILPEQPLPTVSLAPDGRIVDFINQVSSDSLQNFVTFLSNNFTTRNSLSTTSAVAAVNWVESQLKSYGFTTSQQPFRSGYCNNVIAEQTGTVLPNEVVVIGAHLDDRAGTSTDATSRAPGADDNGTGSALILEFARLIQANNMKFERTVRLVTFCGEEQGLYGSAAMAQSFKTEGKTNAYYNADMIGYNCAGKGNAPTLAFMSGASSTTLTQECRTIIREYLPSLAQGTTTACCSDQQSFNTQGIAALGIFECPGSGVAYPDYHKSTDVVTNVDFNQVKLFAQSVISCFMTRAVVSTPI